MEGTIQVEVSAALCEEMVPDIRLHGDYRAPLGVWTLGEEKISASAIGPRLPSCSACVVFTML
jgi:hypothetical protein